MFSLKHKKIQLGLKKQIETKASSVSQVFNKKLFTQDASLGFSNSRAQAIRAFGADSKVKSKPIISTLLMAFLLVGCEASLNLDNVNKELEKPVRRTDQLQGLAVNNDIIVAIGADGANALVLSSDKNELNWKRRVISKGNNLVDVASCPDQSFVALSTDKKVYRSEDNGLNWQANSLDTPEDLMTISCGGDNSIWVGGSFSTLMSSKDKGATWTTNSLNEDAMLTAIKFIDDNTMLAFGEFGLMARSDDKGQTWNPPVYIPNDFYVQNAHFVSADEGWVAGLAGQILYTKDGGNNWAKQDTNTESPIYGFYSFDNRLIAFGDHSTLLELETDKWQPVGKPGRPVYLRSAHSLEKGKLLLAGGFGTLYTQDLSSTTSTTNR